MSSTTITALSAEIEAQIGHRCENCGEPGAEPVQLQLYVGGRGYQPVTRWYCREYEDCTRRWSQQHEAQA